MPQSRKITLFYTMISSIMLMAASPVLAQTLPPRATGSAAAQPDGQPVVGNTPPVAAGSLAGPSEPTAIGEIVVTALKGATSIQNVPATVEVVRREELRASAINTIEQLRTVAPGVIIQRPPNNTANASIRGLGTAPGPVSFDQSVSLFVDGVYAARGADFLSSLFDLESVQVVKGTQSAILGKNTSVGAIVLETRKPGRVFEGDLTANYETEYGSKTVSGGVDIPLGDTLAVRIAAQYQDLAGFLTNDVKTPPAESNARQTREDAVRVTAVWRPLPKLDATLSVSHEDLRNVGLPAEIVVGSAGLQTLYNLSGYGALYETNQNYHYQTYNSDGPTRIKQPSDRATATIDYDLGFAKLTSITGLSDFNQRRYLDYDYIPGNYLKDQTAINGNQFSQELRLASSPNDRLSYMFGGLYINNLLKQNETETATYPGGIAGPIPIAGAFNATFHQITETYSGFTQIGFAVTDKFKLVGAGRLTNEAKSVDIARTTLVPGRFSTTNNPPYPLTHLSRSETDLDGSITAQYRILPRAMIYASWGQGTKGGGFSDFNIPANAEYKKEVAQTYEAGFKLEAPDRLWRLDAAGFHTDVNNYQNNFYNGTTFVVQNLNIVSDGAEVEGFLEPVHDLRFNLDGTYADSRNLSHAPGIGDRLPRSPRLSGKVGVNYDHDLTGSLSGYVGTDLTYRSMITSQTNPAAVPVGKAFPTLSAILGVRGPDRKWDLALIGHNLLGAKSISFASPVPNVPGAVFAIPEDPRTVTLQLSLGF